MMIKKILLFLIIFPTLSFTQPQQPNYTITVNTNQAWDANLFFQRGGTAPRPVKIIDSAGTEIFSQNWGMKGWDFKVNYNNKLSYFDRSSKGWFIMDSLQNEIDSVYCQNGYIADNHDFLALPNGNYVLIAYDEQPYAMDTVVAGGDPNAIVEGLIIQELDSNHNLLFEWKSWDHFHVTDNTYLSPWTGSQLNFIHANAIDIDFDGHFIISSRGLDEITKIHRTTGEVIWRWGGSQNEFTFINDYPFTHQHSIRSLGDNRYLLYDNGNHSDTYIGVKLSRAVEYELDTNLMTAEKVWEFVHPDSLYTPSISGVQRLPNGNTLIDFGNLQWLNIGSIITEVDTNSQIVFQLEYDDGGNLYRAQKFDWFFASQNVGCMDLLACNYDSTANVDDGSCCYPTPTIAITLDTCDSYSWNGTNYTTSGTYINTFPNQCGCDSTIILDLWIKHSSSSLVTDTGHNNYTWNGIEYTQSGIYTFTTTNSEGCDSIITLDLTMINSTNINEINSNSKEYRITNVLGKETSPKKNTPLFYIYTDGRVEKKIILE